MCVTSLEAEEGGLDDAEHGEAGYHGDESGHGGLEGLQLPEALAAPAPMFEASEA